MRKDVKEEVRTMLKDGTKINYAELSRQFNCDYRTVKKAKEEILNNENYPKVRKRKSSKLDLFKDIIEEKSKCAISAKSIYYFISKKGYTGGYGLVKKYCREYKAEQVKKATIRFETVIGLQAQVDWKEELKLISRDGTTYHVNIFLTLLGYSRMKYIELTLDRNQDTLEKALINSFKYFGGVPKEIIFDNMKTVVDQSRTNYQEAKINQKFYQFSKDMGFDVWACRPFRPQTKGKVEALARTMDRLKVFNGEFETLEDLDKIVKELNYDLNHEVSQATNTEPVKLHEKEKEYLLSLPNHDVIDCYFNTHIERKVSHESMIVYNNNKYSLDPYYIGKTVEIKVIDDNLIIFFEGIEVSRHKISEKKFNYREIDMVNILQSDALKDKPTTEIELFAKQQLELYDKL